MSDTSTQDFFTQQAADARGPEEPKRRPTRRRRRLKRIAIAAGASLVVTTGAVVGGGYLYVHHLVSSIHRIHIAALTAAHQPAEEHGSMNVLLTDSGTVPGRNAQTGLIELMHLNANGQGGAVISFPANTVVQVPGRGHRRIELGDTLALGGPSLMIETLERLTDVRIDHYSVVDFGGLAQAVGAMGGVNVNVPFTTTSFGFTFPAGIDHLNSADALAYARQPAVSEVGRMELQENLFRAILRKIANQGLFATTNSSVLNAVVGAVSVDSNFSNSQLVHLALSLRHLEGSDGVSIDVPTSGRPRQGGDQPVFLNTRLDRQLFHAIRHDSVAQFAQRYPFTVTPGAPA